MRPKDFEKEEAIRSIALRIIAEEGLENLSMQKLAKEANISPRTIYIKYENKEDLLIKLFIDEVLGNYEKAVLEGFEETMNFEEGVRKIWLNTFKYFKSNRQSYILMQYGKSSPLLNKAFKERNINEGDFFAPVHRFLKRNIKNGTIKSFPIGVLRALLFAPLLDLSNEYFEYKERPKQIITEKVLSDCCDAIIEGIKL
ncbi:MAG: TetR/AcrR family transcriptional regulator [Sporocytophaga sp.]|nr:TetR/AcrR family transcriptional regulator [Sporocytophaga sp.]